MPVQHLTSLTLVFFIQVEPAWPQVSIQHLLVRLRLVKQMAFLKAILNIILGRKWLCISWRHRCQLWERRSRGWRSKVSFTNRVVPQDGSQRFPHAPGWPPSAHLRAPGDDNIRYYNWALQKVRKNKAKANIWYSIAHMFYIRPSMVRLGSINKKNTEPFLVYLNSIVPNTTF